MAAASSSAALTRLTPTLEPEVRGLDEAGKAELGGDQLLHRAGIAPPLVAPDEHVLHDRQPVGPEDVLHRRLVHADGRGEHARARVRQARQLEESLDGPVLALGAVEQDQHHVEALAEAGGQALGALHPRERARGLAGGGAVEQLALGLGLRPALGQRELRGRPAQRAERIAADEPAPVLGDADRHDVEARAVDRGHHRRGAREGDLVLTRSSAEHHAHAQSLVSHDFLYQSPAAAQPCSFRATRIAVRRRAARRATAARPGGARRAPSRRRGRWGDSRRGRGARRAGAPGSRAPPARRGRTGSRARNRGWP